MAAVVTTVPITVSTQTWLVNSATGQAGATAEATITISANAIICPDMAAPIFPGVLTVFPPGAPININPTPPYTIIGKTGHNVILSCVYNIVATSQAVEASPLTSTVEITTSSTTAETKSTTRTSSPATASGPKNSESSTPNLSTVALSGICIGALVLGILLGLAAAGCLLCCRRRLNKNSRMLHAEERSAMLLSAPPVPLSKDPATNSPSSQTQSSPRITSTSAAAVIASPTTLSQPNLLQPSEDASDDVITQELIYLGNLIEEHVKNNYHLNPLSINHSVLRDSLDGLNLNEAMKNHIAVLGLAPQTRHVAIRHFLALAIFSALDVYYAHGVSLLPPGVTTFMQSLPCDKPEDYQYSTTALDTWRRASAYLLNNNTNKSTPLSPKESPNTQIECFHAAVNRFLSHFVHEDSRAVFDQTKNLEGVIYECAVFGYSIFSHPCLWRYTYVPENNQSTSSNLEKSSLVVLPGLEKLSRPGGEVLSHPDVLVSPSVVSV